MWGLVSRWLSVAVTVVDKMRDGSRGHVGSGEAVEECERKREAGPESGRRWEVLVGEKSRELTEHPKSGREGTPHRHLLSLCCFGSQGLRFYCLLPVIQMCFFY